MLKTLNPFVTWTIQFGK